MNDRSCFRNVSSFSSKPGLRVLVILSSPAGRRAGGRGAGGGGGGGEGRGCGGRRRRCRRIELELERGVERVGGRRCGDLDRLRCGRRRGRRRRCGRGRGPGRRWRGRRVGELGGEPEPRAARLLGRGRLGRELGRRGQRWRRRSRRWRCRDRRGRRGRRGRGRRAAARRRRGRRRWRCRAGRGCGRGRAWRCGCGGGGALRSGRTRLRLHHDAAEAAGQRLRGRRRRGGRRGGRCGRRCGCGRGLLAPSTRRFRRTRRRLLLSPRGIIGRGECRPLGARRLPPERRSQGVIGLGVVDEVRCTLVGALAPHVLGKDRLVVQGLLERGRRRPAYAYEHDDDRTGRDQCDGEEDQREHRTPSRQQCIPSPPPVRSRASGRARPLNMITTSRDGGI